MREASPQGLLGHFVVYLVFFLAQSVPCVHKGLKNVTFEYQDLNAGLNSNSLELTSCLAQVQPCAPTRS